MLHEAITQEGCAVTVGRRFDDQEQRQTYFLLLDAAKDFVRAAVGLCHVAGAATSREVWTPEIDISQFRCIDSKSTSEIIFFTCFLHYVNVSALLTHDLHFCHCTVEVLAFSSHASALPLNQSVETTATNKAMITLALACTTRISTG